MFAPGNDPVHPPPDTAPVSRSPLFKYSVPSGLAGAVQAADRKS